MPIPLEKIAKYIKSSTHKDCLDLAEYLDKKLRCKSSYKRELIKLVLLSNSSIRDSILDTINYKQRRVLRPLKEGLEAEGYTACVLRHNQYQNMKEILKKAFGNAFMYSDRVMLR